MKIRFAEEKDCDQILFLFDELLEEVSSQQGKTYTPTDHRIREDRYKEAIANNRVKIFVAEDQDTLVGLANTYTDNIIRRGVDYLRVEDMVVIKSYRGKGVGTLLLNAIKDYCHKNNIHVIRLNSGIENENAHRFYEKNGGKFTEKMFRFDI